jgi:hypothetical protein
MADGVGMCFTIEISDYIFLGLCTITGVKGIRFNINIPYLEGKGSLAARGGMGGRRNGGVRGDGGRGRDGVRGWTRSEGGGGRAAINRGGINPLPTKTGFSLRREVAFCIYGIGTNPYGYRARGLAPWRGRGRAPHPTLWLCV